MSMYNILINYFVTINRFDVIYNQNEHLLIKDNYHLINIINILYNEIYKSFYEKIKIK
ncbi:hypothetical protein PFBG_01056 [Plasmodium falciparum 7G8]|uniref:Uncharacterized protein n=1 Tax=Plasmodium falciparum (isolate 7G8) TaxID=57266 RepID=W7F6F1_PLAF8|nr:hypothetical protein PFBG_01056 [Plasmodium falciparum 7G8]